MTFNFLLADLYLPDVKIPMDKAVEQYKLRLWITKIKDIVLKMGDDDKDTSVRVAVR